MATIEFTRNLYRFFPHLREVALDVSGTTVAEALAELRAREPRLVDYICYEHGGLRKHVNIFIGEETVTDRQQLSDPIGDNDRLYVIQALSGG